MLCFSDYGFAAARPFTTQLQILASALWFRPSGLVVIPWGLLLQWRIPDPGLNLPFMFFQIVGPGASARAADAPEHMVFGAGVRTALLRIFLLLDDGAGGTEYRFPAGSRSAQSLRRHAMHRRGHRSAAVAIQYPSESAALGRSDEAVRPVHAGSETVRKHHAHALPPCPGGDRLVDLEVEEIRPALRMELVAGGILLSRSRVVSGICFHEYHYGWLWAPIRGALVLIVATSIVNVRFRWRPAAAAICWTLLMLYFAGGVYLAAICVTRTWSGVEQVQNYTRYKTQRMAEAVKPLAPGATIAGDDGFCEVAAVAEDQWVLSGEAVPRSLVADNDQWESRAALNAYLLGTDRAEFEKAARSDAEHWFWESPERQPQVLDAFMRKYDEVVQNPDRFIAEFGVRYVALPADKADRGYPARGLEDASAGTVLANLGERKIPLLNS